MIDLPNMPLHFLNCCDDQARRKILYGLMGDLPERQRPIKARKISEEERDDYLLERLELDLNGIEIVPAYFVKPLWGFRKAAHDSV